MGDVTEFTPGKLYLLVGGHVMRYQGPWGQDNHAPLLPGYCLAFSAPNIAVHAPAVGYSANPERVRQEVTAADLPWLYERYKQEKARKLPLENTALVIRELGGEVPDE